MSHSFIALTTAIFVVAAAPSSAFSLQLSFHTLTYPTQPSPDLSQGCVQPATLHLASLRYHNEVAPISDGICFFRTPSLHSPCPK
jgi:hypothetical protein